MLRALKRPTFLTYNHRLRRGGWSPAWGSPGTTPPTPSTSSQRFSPTLSYKIQVKTTYLPLKTLPALLSIDFVDCLYISLSLVCELFTRNRLKIQRTEESSYHEMSGFYSTASVNSLSTSFLKYWNLCFWYWLYWWCGGRRLREALRISPVFFLAAN